MTSLEIGGEETVGLGPRIKKLKTDIQDVGEAVQDMLNQIDKEMTWVIIIGMTGSGKTTLLHALAGRSLVVAEDQFTGSLHLEARSLWTNEGRVIAIGQDVQSETFIPNIWVDESNGIAYFDCPGFLDTLGERRLINAFSIDQILANAKKVKILLVLAQGELECKAVDARNSLAMLSKTIPNEGELSRALGIVVTKVQPRRRPVEMLRRLAIENERCFEVINNIVNTDEKRVFVSLEPYDVSNGNGNEYCFLQDKEELISFLKHNPVVDPHHESAIDAETQVMLVRLCRVFNDDMLKALLCLAEVIDDETNKLNNEKEMEVWMQYLNELKTTAQKGWKEFSDSCQIISTKCESLIGPAQGIARLVPWVEFIERILMSSSETKLIMTEDNSPNYPLKIALREYNGYAERLKFKLQNLNNDKKISALQTEVRDLRSRPIEIHHHHDRSCFLQ